MNLHVLTDILAAAGDMYGDRMKFFREGCESPHVSEMIRELELDFLGAAHRGARPVPEISRYRTDRLRGHVARRVDHQPASQLLRQLQRVPADLRRRRSRSPLLGYRLYKTAGGLSTQRGKFPPYTGSDKLRAELCAKEQRQRSCLHGPLRPVHSSRTAVRHLPSRADSPARAGPCDRLSGPKGARPTSVRWRAVINKP